MKIYTIGHKKPDLDSVVAAISFASLQSKLQNREVTPAITEEINEETKFVLNKFNFTVPTILTSAQITPEDQIVLVDHNEADQRLDGLNPDQIVALYDHHKVNLNLGHPIEIQVYPVGSSNTIAWMLFKKQGIAIDQTIAPLMLSAILSDTVGLKSSTTTNTDREAVQDLLSLSGITDIDSLTLEIFKAKSNISALSDEQVVLNDYKIFDFSGKKVLIGQTETVEQDVLLNTRKAGLLAALSKIKAEQQVDLIYLALTDILKVNTKMLVIGEPEKTVIEKSFAVQVIDNIADIGPKMSRKKDINPVIEQTLANS